MALATGAVDARALRLADGSVVRLAAIEPFGILDPALAHAEDALKARLGALVAEVEVAILPVSDTLDRYGRVAAVVAIDGEPIQAILAREGLAVAFAADPALPCFEAILAAEAEARQAGRGFWAAHGALPPARPAALAPFVGRFAVFEGVVLSVGNRRATTYLNFGRRWSEDVTIEIIAADRKFFGGEAGLAALAGRKIRARGYLEERSGPMLRVRSPMQIEVLDASGGTIPSAP